MARTNKNPGAAATASGADRHHSSRKRGEHKPAKRTPQRRIAFTKINSAALAQFTSLLARWLPGGKVSSGDYVSLNPKRIDRRAGSFRICVASGKWIDFATKDKGGDPVSLFAFLNGVKQTQAALDLARLLGVDPYERRERQWRR